jgi:predicted transcriptional regulator
MRPKSLKLGELELEVLKVVWERQPCTVQEVAEVMEKQRGSARTTVLTVMQRLHAKKFLKRTKRDGVYRYSPTQDQEKVLSGLIGRFVDRVLDGSALPFVSYLAEAKGLTPEQVETLRAIVRKLEEGEDEKP